MNQKAHPSAPKVASLEHRLLFPPHLFQIKVFGEESLLMESLTSSKWTEGNTAKKKKMFPSFDFLLERRVFSSADGVQTAPSLRL